MKEYRIVYNNYHNNLKRMIRIKGIKELNKKLEWIANNDYTLVKVTEK